MTKHILKGNADTMEVFLDGELLDPKPSQEVYNHSPDGFNWGYEGSGPAQLAMAVILKITGDIDGYMNFKRNIIAHLPGGEDFETTFEL
jgi:hypothetical protein